MTKNNEICENKGSIIEASINNEMSSISECGEILAVVIVEE